MKISRLESTRGGWFVGDFQPSLFTTPHAEVSVQLFAAGDYAPAERFRHSVMIKN